MSDEQRAFWTKVASAYDSVVDLQIGGNTRAILRDRVAREGNLGNVAEFGCGTGYFTALLAAKAESLVATDLAPGMLAIAEQRCQAANVRFQQENCQKSSLPDAAFDTAFLSLVIHFTEPAVTLAEMARILKPGGTLLICNLDPTLLTGFKRLRCRIRVIYYGVSRYRTKPPKNFGAHILNGNALCDLLAGSGFDVLSMETFRNQPAGSDVPIEYIRATRR